MDSSTEEEYIFLGIALPNYEEDEVVIRKPVAVHEQVVRDEQGRVRFHGAFTGGFSAGYFNTVDTKEGWAPQSFRSSRGERAGAVTQKAEDFMDDEDVGEFGIAPKSLKTTQPFQSTHETSKLPPSTEIQLARLRIGTRMLRKMGWRKGEGVGEVRRKRKKKIADVPKVYGCSLPPQLISTMTSKRDSDSEDEDDDDDNDDELRVEDMCKVRFETKIDQHGLGYRGMNVGGGGGGLDGSVIGVGLDQAGRGGEITAGGELYSKRGGGQKGVDRGLAMSKAKNLIKGQAFGTGAFEDEDEDVYNNDNINNYIFDLSHEDDTNNNDNYGWTAPKHHYDTKLKNTLRGFKKASSSSLPKQPSFPPPDLPRNFTPYRNIPKNKATNIPTINHDLNSGHKPHHRHKPEYYMNLHHKRGEMLGEKLQLNSVFDLVKENDKARIEATKKDIEKKKETRKQTSKQTSRWTRADDQSDNKTKIKEMVDRTVEEIKNDKRVIKEEMACSQGVTEWETARPLSTLMAGRFVRETGSSGRDVKEEMEEVGRVSAVEWHPAKLVCVRFNVEDPFPDSQIIGLLTTKKVKPSFFDFKTPISVVIGSQQIIHSTNVSSQDNTAIISIENIDNDTVREPERNAPNKTDSDTNVKTTEKKTKRSSEKRPLAVLASVDLRTTPACVDHCLNLIPPDQPPSTPDQPTSAPRMTSQNTGKNLLEQSNLDEVDGEVNEAALITNIELLKPSMNVFKSIFESSDEEDGDSMKHVNDIITQASIQTIIPTITTTSLSIHTQSANITTTIPIPSLSMTIQSTNVATTTNQPTTHSFTDNTKSIIIDDDGDDDDLSDVTVDKNVIESKAPSSKLVWVPKIEKYIEKTSKKSKHKKHKHKKDKKAKKNKDRKKKDK